MLLQRMFQCFRKSSSRTSKIPEESSSIGLSSPRTESSTRTVEIPEDLVIEILWRVPAEFVIKFRSLSKFYRDLIDSPEFERKHTLLSVKKTCSHIFLNACVAYSDYLVAVLKSGSPESVTKIDKPIETLKREGYFIQGGCLGILCLGKRYVGEIILLNPLTGYSSRKIKYETDFNILTTLILGHDAVTDDFKILKICRECVDLENYDCEVYSSKMDSWKKVPNGHPKLCLFRGGVFVEGTNSIHFLNTTPTEGITVFNFHSDKYGIIHLPTDYREDMNSRHRSELCCLDGRLCYYTKTGEYWSAWMMKEYGSSVNESWTMLCCLDDTKYNLGLIKPLHFRNDNSLLLLAKRSEDSEHYYTVRYDLEEKEMTWPMIRLIEMDSTKLWPPEHFLYTPSLRRV